MTPDQFDLCASVARDFIYDSEPCPRGRRKVLGIFGGDPLLSPHFPQYVDSLCHHVTDAWNRGLWTSADWQTYENPKYGRAEPHVLRLLGSNYSGTVWERDREAKGGRWGGGYLNWNQHDGFDPARQQQTCEHQPVLVSISDVVKDEARRWQLISDCWIPDDWSACYALDAHNEPRFWWCEIASGFDRVFDLGVGLPVEKDCWRGDLWFEPNEHGVLQPCGKFSLQITETCTRCGAAIPLPGRRDLEYRDDISPSNVAALQACGSPMVARGDFVEFGQQQIDEYNEQRARDGWRPMAYIRSKDK